MPEYKVTVHRSQTFLVNAENIEEAHQLCLDGQLIDDEIVDIFTLVDPHVAENKED